jgi:type IV fimbrial biogenesis protein FimT
MTSNGFTLVEMSIVVGIGAIVAALAAPNFSAFLEGRKVRAGAEQLRDLLLLAGQEAMKRNAPVIVMSDGNLVTASIAAFGANQSVELSRFQTRTRVTATSVTMNGSGRASASAVFAFAPLHSSCKAAGGPVSCYNVQVQAGGAVRLCDPTYAQGNVRGCL